jgi:hypothetical protein
VVEPQKGAKSHENEDSLCAFSCPFVAIVAMTLVSAVPALPETCSEISLR